jgi:hypothetical protein
VTISKNKNFLIKVVIAYYIFNWNELKFK